MVFIKQADRMKQKRLVYLSSGEMRALFEDEFPDLCRIARACGSPANFSEAFGKWLSRTFPTGGAGADLLAGMLENEGKTVFESSVGEPVTLHTFAHLYRFLQEGEASGVSPDALADLYSLLTLPDGEDTPPPGRMKRLVSRWATGSDEPVSACRERNKEYMIPLLVEKIGRKSHASARFHFEEPMDDAAKTAKVREWWNDYRFHLAMAVRTPAELNRFLGGSLSAETMRILSDAAKKQIPFFVTPYYLSLLNTGSGGFDDAVLRSYILYSRELVDAFGTIRAWEREDRVVPGHPNAAGWLLPEGGNIHRRYPDGAILIPDTMGRACGGLCASCQRMYDFQSRRLNFELETLKPKESWERKLRRLMDYFEQDTQLRDILITGGDALMSRNETLKHMLDAIYRMALRKRRANAGRKAGEKYAELQRVRLGTRLPVYLPMRIDDELVRILSDFREKAETAGIRQLVIQTHFQTPLEMTPEAREGIRRLLSCGWTVTNQTVYNAAVSRRGHLARLRQTLNEAGVLCYYTFSVKGFAENRAVFAPNARSLQEREEEKRAGRLTEDQRKELLELFRTSPDKAAALRGFMQRHRLPFLATDRSVLNLPGLGKSMTFRLAGLTAEGRRILRFGHDTTRKHSPVVHAMPDVYITENKSLAAYLRQLDGMGESPEDYRSLWRYGRGETEPRFELYEYPEFDFETTEAFSNLVVEER